MTKKLIPEGNERYSGEDYATASDRFQAARQRVMDVPKASVAHRALSEEITVRVGRRRATLAQIRRAVELTQAEMADHLGVNQAWVSKIERSRNLNLATLSRFIEATGGRLRLVAEYGDDAVDITVGEILSDENPLVDV